ncbi:hypothetical protein [Yersinia sp. 1652 StPb PI]|uniref:hypothetical protein n=1 Tax=Yersinia sp. 1652 StPb PI TaxID=3061649 RepID=UPI00355BCAE3
MHDKITLGIDSRVMTDIDTRQRPQYGLAALNRTIITAGSDVMGNSGGRCWLNNEINCGYMALME